MKLCSHYLWEKGQGMLYNPVSVVLQQAEYEKRQVLFACVCDSVLEGQEGVAESGYFSERLTEWFHKRYLKRFVKNKESAETLLDLHKEKEMVLQELVKSHEKKRQGLGLHFCVILIQDNQFVMMQKGLCHIFLLNRRYNNRQIKRWEQFDEIGECHGKIQRNLGLLLCTNGFGEKLTQKDYKEALFMDKKTEDWRLQKRLAEVWQDMRCFEKSESVGAVYIRTY